MNKCNCIFLIFQIIIEYYFNMSVRINDQEFDTEYFSSPEELEHGLMGRESFEGCAVFNVGRGHHSFWMKNCLLNLDIVFVYNNKITKIYSNCQPETVNSFNIKKYFGFGNYVLEFIGGTSKNWSVGDNVFIY